MGPVLSPRVSLRRLGLAGVCAKSYGGIPREHLSLAGACDKSLGLSGDT